MATTHRTGEDGREERRGDVDLAAPEGDGNRAEGDRVVIGSLHPGPPWGVRPRGWRYALGP